MFQTKYSNDKGKRTFRSVSNTIILSATIWKGWECRREVRGWKLDMRVEIENDKIDKRGEKVKKGKERKRDIRRGNKG